jgi:hypothetical protein
VRLKLFQQVQCAESAQTVETVLIDVMARSTNSSWVLIGFPRTPERNLRPSRLNFNSHF